MSEWSDWIEHDGKGCPCVGECVRVIVQNKWGFEAELVGVPRNSTLRSWDWAHFPEFKRVTRYRIRKPRALLDLVQLVENLPAPATPKVDA